MSPRRFEKHCSRPHFHPRLNLVRIQVHPARMPEGMISERFSPTRSSRQTCAAWASRRSTEDVDGAIFHGSRGFDLLYQLLATIRVHIALTIFARFVLFAVKSVWSRLLCDSAPLRENLPSSPSTQRVIPPLRTVPPPSRGCGTSAGACFPEAPGCRPKTGQAPQGRDSRAE